MKTCPLPLYNNATQQRTAPGSTFKMVTATAGLTEGVLSRLQNRSWMKDSLQKSNSLARNVGYIRANHGLINVSEAIRDSCNYFFYEVGYRLSSTGDTYNETKGITAIQKYAEMYGLGDTTGIEIPENAPQIATKVPILAAIGQSDNNYTTTELARYVTAVANSGTVYNYTLLSKVTDSDGNLIESYEPTVKKTRLRGSANLPGMPFIPVCAWWWKATKEFDGFPIAVAGKPVRRSRS